MNKNDAGLICIKSPYSADQTTSRLAAILESHGMTIFARIDQQAAAVHAGLTMRAMQLLIFGNPASGTPLMIKYPSLAIDLPLKALVWEDENGQVWISINSPEYLKERHGLPILPFGAVQGLVEMAVS